MGPDSAAALLAALGETQNPGIRSLKISLFLRDARAGGWLNLYEQFLLHGEALAYEHQFCCLPAWDRGVPISHLTALLNMKMMALLFEEPAAAAVWEDRAMEAYGYPRRETRPHFILDHYPALLRGEPEALKALLALRGRRRRPFDQGPYHDECFPFRLCVWEEWLLEGRRFSPAEKVLREEAGDLLAELCLL